MATQLNWTYLFALEREARPFRRARPDARIQIIGVGREQARAATQAIIEEQRPTGLLLAGFAGGLVPRLRVGDILVPAEIVGESTNFNDLPNAAGRLLTTNRIFGNPVEKASLGNTADAVDMESAVVACICRERGVPFGCVRVISDTVDDELSPELIELMSAGEPTALAAAAWLARRPMALPVLLRLARNSRIAADRLCDFLTSV